jgi:polar amino acid transport system substrate-binding protein
MAGWRQAIMAAGAAALLAFSIGATAARADDAVNGGDFWKKIQDAGVLRVGGAEATPYQMRDPKTGQWEGVYIDILQRLADQLGVKLEVTETSWDNFVSGLIAGKWDIAPALNRTVKRSLVVNYSIPAHSYQISFVFKNDNSKIDHSWTSLEDFDKAGVTFAVKGGTAEEQVLSERVKNATINRFPDQDTFRLAVVSGRADVAVDDADPNSIFAAGYPDWAQTVLPDPPLARQGVAFGFAKNVPLEDIQTLDILIEQMVATGEVDQMFKDYATKLAKAQ